MKFIPSLFALAAVFSITLGGQAASVGPAGYFNDFASPPAAADFSTTSIAGGANGAADSTTATRVDTNIAALAAASITATLAVSNANPPNATGPAVYASAGYLQTRANGNRITVLMATLVNDTGSNVTRVTLSYDFASSGSGTEEVAGHRVYYSRTGAAGSWANITALSSAPPGPLSAQLDFNWNSGSTLYVLWADDNGTATPDLACQIDNFSVTTSDPTLPLTVNLTTPDDGALFVAPDTASVSVGAAVGGTIPPTSVSFYANSVLAVTVPGPGPHAAVLTLAPGTHTLHAVAVNGVDPAAASPARTIRVRQEYVNYTGGTFLEDFNGLGAAGMETPIGWYVGGALPAGTVAVTVGDGSLPPAATILGWNYGNSTDPQDRALGTAAVTADRNTVLRLRNNTSSNLVAFEVRYDGEVWRQHTTLMESLTNFVSYNLGGSWTRTTFDFVSPVEPLMPATALDGHAPAHRLTGLGGVITPPQPIAPGGVIYLRWFNRNDADTDGALAVDNVSFRGTAFSASGAVAPSLHLATDGLDYTVTWNDAGNLYRLQQSTGLGNPADWTDVPNDPTSPYIQPLPEAPSHRFYRLTQRP